MRPLPPPNVYKIFKFDGIHLTTLDIDRLTLAINHKWIQITNDFKAPSCLFTFLLTLTSPPAVICNQQRHPNSGGRWRWSCEYNICMCVCEGCGVGQQQAVGAPRRAHAQLAPSTPPPAAQQSFSRRERAGGLCVCVRYVSVPQHAWITPCIVVSTSSRLGLLIVQTGTFPGNLALNKVLHKSCSDRMFTFTTILNIPELKILLLPVT